MHPCKFSLRDARWPWRSALLAAGLIGAAALSAAEPSWQRSFSLSSADLGRVQSPVLSLPDGGALLSVNLDGWPAFARLDASGRVLWQHSYADRRRQPGIGSSAFVADAEWVGDGFLLRLEQVPGASQRLLSLDDSGRVLGEDGVTRQLRAIDIQSTRIAALIADAADPSRLRLELRDAGRAPRAVTAAFFDPLALTLGPWALGDGGAVVVSGGAADATREGQPRLERYGADGQRWWSISATPSGVQELTSGGDLLLTFADGATLLRRIDGRSGATRWSLERRTLNNASLRDSLSAADGIYLLVATPIDDGTRNVPVLLRLDAAGVVRARRELPIGTDIVDLDSAPGGGILLATAAESGGRLLRYDQGLREIWSVPAALGRPARLAAEHELWVGLNGPRGARAQRLDPNTGGALAEDAVTAHALSTFAAVFTRDLVPRNLVSLDSDVATSVDSMPLARAALDGQIDVPSGASGQSLARVELIEPDRSGEVWILGQRRAAEGPSHVLRRLDRAGAVAAEYPLSLGASWLAGSARLRVDPRGGVHLLRETPQGGAELIRLDSQGVVQSQRALRLAAGERVIEVQLGREGHSGWLTQSVAESRLRLAWFDAEGQLLAQEDVPVSGAEAPRRLRLAGVDGLGLAHARSICAADSCRLQLGLLAQSGGWSRSIANADADFETPAQPIESRIAILQGASASLQIYNRRDGASVRQWNLPASAARWARPLWTAGGLLVVAAPTRSSGSAVDDGVWLRAHNEVDPVVWETRYLPKAGEELRFRGLTQDGLGATVALERQAPASVVRVELARLPNDRWQPRE